MGKSLKDRGKYLSIVGTSQCVNGLCRPNIRYIVNFLRCQSHQPTNKSLKVAKRVLSYLLVTKEKKVKISNDSKMNVLERISVQKDNDWAQK